MTATHRFDFIDSLRGLAILGVIIAHVGSHALTGTSTLEITVRRISDIGGIGVPLFYVVSAFTIMLMYSKRYKSENNYIASFYVRRIFRIAPVYWGGIILYTLVYGVTGSREWQPGPELWHYILHFTFTNMTNPVTPSSVVPGGWSISNEVLFYAIFPALFLMVRNLKSAIIFFAATILISPFVEYAGSAFLNYFHADISDKQYNQFLYRWLPNQISCFAAGIVFFYIYKNITNEQVSALIKNKGKFILLISSLLAVAVASKLSFLQENHAWSVLFIALAIGAMVYKWKILVNKYMIYLGKISFSAYIFHFLVIKFSDRLLLSSLEMNGIVHFAILSILTLAITVAIAHISFKYYEAFFTRLTAKAIELIQRNSAKQQMA